MKKHPVVSSLPPTSLTPVVNLGLGISSRNFDKFKVLLSALSGGAQCLLKKKPQLKKLVKVSL
jgi:hypothetical protein